MLGDNKVHAIIAVKDLDEAKKFYEEVVGLEKVDESPGGVTYKSGDSSVFVYPSEFAGTNKANAASWEVSDVDAVVADLKDKGVSFEHYDNIPGVKVEETGGIRIAEETIDGKHKYSATVKFTKRQKRERDESETVFNKQLEDIVEKIGSAGRSVAWMPKSTQLDGKVSGMVEVKPPKEFHLTIPPDVAPYFQNIFDRDSQIRVINSSIQAAIATSFQKRNHCLLWGKPACAKTEVMAGFIRMLGEDNVVKFDATMTTKAGMEKHLMEMQSIPPVIFIEEIEKCAPVNLSPLLGILDHRGEIIKTNARIGHEQKPAKCLCIATVNNLAEFKNVMAGALASRFSHHIYFPRPSVEVLTKILLREVTEIGGNPEWVKPAIEYCMTIEKTNDPRRCIAVLDGGDKLLTGEYQEDLKRIRKAQEIDHMDEGIS